MGLLRQWLHVSRVEVTDEAVIQTEVGVGLDQGLYLKKKWVGLILQMFRKG